MTTFLSCCKTFIEDNTCLLSLACIILMADLPLLLYKFQETLSQLQMFTQLKAIRHMDE